MDSHSHKLSNKKKQTLRSLFVGSLFAICLYIVNEFSSFSLCPIKNIFEINCFGCGLTRGIIAILKLDFDYAIRCNVLSVPIFLGIVLYCSLAFAEIVLDKNWLERIENQMSKRYMYMGYVLILIIATILNNHFRV